MITISRQQSHFRLYAWTRRRLDTFWARPPDHRRAFNLGVDQINLCPYMRTLLLYLPLLVLLHLAVFGLLFFSFVWVPSEWLGHLPFGAFFWTILRYLGYVAVIAAVLGVGVLIGMGCVWLYRKCMSQKEQQHAGFCHLVAEYYISWHEKFCPGMRVE